MTDKIKNENKEREAFFAFFVVVEEESNKQKVMFVSSDGIHLGKSMDEAMNLKGVLKGKEWSEEDIIELLSGKDINGYSLTNMMSGSVISVKEGNDKIPEVSVNKMSNFNPEELIRRVKSSHKVDFAEVLSGISKKPTNPTNPKNGL